MAHDESWEGDVEQAHGEQVGDTKPIRIGWREGVEGGGGEATRRIEVLLDQCR